MDNIFGGMLGFIVGLIFLFACILTGVDLYEPLYGDGLALVRVVVAGFWFSMLGSFIGSCAPKSR